MKRLFRAVPMVLVLVALLVVPVSAGGPTQSSNVYDFATGDPIPGSQATLKRQNNKIHLNIKTKDLEAGAAYTVWWVVFNNPEECSDMCGEDDLPPFNPDANPAVQASVLFAAGHVIGNNGKGNFAGNLKEGDTGGALFGPGLLDSDKAEVHIVVRNHRQPIPGLVDEMISTFGGGCDVNTGGTLPVGAGNECFDEQFAIFL